MMRFEHLRSHFDREAEAYDAGILPMVPQYREQGEILLQVLPFDADRPLRVIDLGWLHEAGFVGVAGHCQRVNFAVVSGNKA